MRTQSQLAPYTFSDTSPKGFYHQVSPAGFTIGKKTRRHARALPWPEGSGPTTGLQHPTTSKRQFSAFLFRTWKTALSPANRASYAAIAALLPMQNNKGGYHTISPYNWFVRWHTQAFYQWYTPPGQFLPDPTLLTLDAGHISTTNGTTYNILPTYVRPGTLTLIFNDTGVFFPGIAVLQISNPKRATTSSYGSHWSLIPGTASGPGSPPSPFTAVFNYQYLIEIPPRPGLRWLRLAAINTPGAQFVAFWTAFQLDLSINVG